MVWFLCYDLPIVLGLLGLLDDWFRSHTRVLCRQTIVGDTEGSYVDLLSVKYPAFNKQFWYPRFETV